jgi:hypothetical protein
MWQQIDRESTDSILKLVYRGPAGPLGYGDLLRLLRDDAGFRADFTRAPADVPHRAYKWETPPVTAATLDRPFECMLIDSPALDVPADSSPFAEHLQRQPEVSSPGIARFPNLGGDALLVVPLAHATPAAYAHLAAFLRLAPPAQHDALWQAVAEAMLGRVGTAPVWLSTAGGGVAWLHVRLDDRPKYYGYGPYRRLA